MHAVRRVLPGRVLLRYLISRRLIFPSLSSRRVLLLSSPDILTSLPSPTVRLPTKHVLSFGSPFRALASTYKPSTEDVGLSLAEKAMPVGDEEADSLHTRRQLEAYFHRTTRWVELLFRWPPR